MLKHLIAMTTLTLLSAPAFAQCTKDTDCKGDRICVQGTCTAPSTSASPATAPKSPTPLPTAHALSGVDRLELQQARSKAKTSLIMAGGTLLTGLGTAATNGAGDAPKVLGGITLGLAGAATPVAAGGSSQARRLALSRGVTLKPSTARATAWTGYGLTMGLGTVVFAAGLSEAIISNELILSLTALGALSATTMALDTLATVNAIEAKAPTARRSERIKPTASLTASATADGAMMGLVGTF